MWRRATPIGFTFRLSSDKTKNFNSVLMRSDDGGETFQSFDIAGTEQQRLAYIAAVHPTQPDRVYLRVLDDKDGLPITVIYMTADGGANLPKDLHGRRPAFRICYLSGWNADGVRRAG